MRAHRYACLLSAGRPTQTRSPQTIKGDGTNVKKIFALLALAGLFLMAGPAHRADALSLINPAVAAAVDQDGTGNAVTEIRWRRYHYRHYYGFHRHYYRRHYYGYRHYGFRHHYRHRYYRFF
jgi:hypothetical protein